MEIYYKLFPCIYTVLKEIISKLCESLISAIAIILTVVFLTIGCFLLFPWYIWHLTMKEYLKFQHKDNFGGLLSLNTMMEHTKMTITFVYILEHHGSYQQLMANVKMSCQSLMESHYRFTSTVRKCCGYYYFLKGQVSINDVISISEEKCPTKKDLLDYLQKNCFRRPDVGVKLWSVKVFKNPITWNGHNKTRCYPVVITYNHCLADAICLSVFHQKHLLEDVTQKNFENALRKSTTSKENLMKSNILQVVTSDLIPSLLSNSENPDQNLALFIEEESRYLELIRKLSKRLQCTFTDMFLIASTLVVADYMEEKNIILRKVRVGNTRRILGEDKSALLDGRIFDNVVSLDVYGLPNLKCNSILERFLKLREALNTQRNSSTSQFLSVIRIIMSYLPAEVFLRLWRPFSQHCLLGVTNMPGVDFARFGGAVVQDSFVFVNHFIDIKFIMGIHSHGGRLQVSLISEKYLITSKEDLQEVLNKVFKVIDDLYEQCELSL